MQTRKSEPHNREISQYGFAYKGIERRTTSGSGDCKGRLFPRIFPVRVVINALQSSGLNCMRASAVSVVFELK